MSEISSLGEFGLIDRLTEGLENTNASTSVGVGDDAAILNYTADSDILVTTDLLLENVHFDLTYVPLKHLGCGEFFGCICHERPAAADYSVAWHIEALYC